MSDEHRLVGFGREHLDEAIELFAAEGWETYSEDPERTFRALRAPGCTTLAAIVDGDLAGLVQVQSDGEIQAHLSLLLVGAQWRARGLGRALLREALRRAGGMRMDVLTRAGDYYLALGADAVPGFRLRPEHVEPGD
jgi:GNAT superfamily N-acetyltransferase